MTLAQMQQKQYAALWVDIAGAKHFAGSTGKADRVLGKVRQLVHTALQHEVSVALAGCRHHI